MNGSLFSVGIPRSHHCFHAPWTRWFKTFYLRGTFAHEVQLGPLVVQVRRRGKRWSHGVVHAWLDRLWRCPIHGLPKEKS